MISEKARQVLLCMAEHYERDPEGHLQNGISERVLGAETHAYLGAVYHEIQELVNVGFISRLDPLNINSKVIITQTGYRSIRPAHVRFLNQIFKSKVVIAQNPSPSTPHQIISKSQSGYLKNKSVKDLRYDIFIAHATEDKDFVKPLAKELQSRGLKVWYDDFILKMGMSLRREIDKGIANSRYGIVVLSPAFFNKDWPQKELDGLIAKDVGYGQSILPIWHNMNKKQVLRYSPTLAGIISAKSTEGLPSIVRKIMEIIQQIEEQ